ncbi:MAG: hypothetical protein V7763_05690 [Sulfitobacter sp.]
MRDRLVARQFEIALEQANAGNMTALKLLDQMMDKNDRMYAERRLERAQRDDDPKEKMGKKERAAIEAKEASESDNWGDDLQFSGGQTH